MIGQKFYRWTITGPKMRRGSAYVCEAQCDCGTKRIVYLAGIKNGHSKSCGCYASERKKDVFFKHGYYLSTEYRTYYGMLKRCNNKEDKRYKDYGGRGIKVCERWTQSFTNFLEDMGNKPFFGAQINRIDNNGDYEPCNCQWTDAKSNMRNMRNSRYATLNGVTKHLAEWSEETGIAYETIRLRISRGWPEEKALTTPSQRNK